jgi:hypothetical protein
LNTVLTREEGKFDTAERLPADERRDFLVEIGGVQDAPPPTPAVTRY